jgi:hypothetical protein
MTHPVIALVIALVALAMPSIASAYHVAPTGLTVAGKSSTTVSLAWDDYTRFAEREYRLNTYTADGVLVDRRFTGSNGETYTRTGLTPSTGYRFSINAVASRGRHVSRSSAPTPVVTTDAVSAPPPSSGYPASYFTGPLGANNILPATAGGALVGGWAGFQGATAQDGINQFTARQNAARREFDLIAVHSGSGATLGGAPSCADVEPADTIATWAINQGSTVYWTWTPGRSTVNGDSIVRQVINGQRDACIDAMANHLEARGVRVMLRPFHEFDFLQYHRRGDGSLDHTTEAAQGQALIDAWRRLVDRFQAAGATNVGFLWNPDEGGGSRTMVAQAYPGNSYVDWVGSDRYNWAGSGWSACDHQGWADFHRIFNHTVALCGGVSPNGLNYHERYGVANGKPFFVGETSTRYDAAMPDRKNQWYADIAKAKDPNDSVRFMSNLIGVAIFDLAVAPENNSDWRIDSNQTAAMASAGQFGTTAPAHGLNGWVQWVNDPRWNVGVRP